MDINTLCESDKKECYKPIRTGNAFSSNYIKYKSNGDKDKTSIEEYLHEIKPYLNDLIDGDKTQCEWKIHLVMAINFMFSKDSNETRTMYAKSVTKEIMIDYETDEIIKELFKSLLERY